MRPIETKLNSLIRRQIRGGQSVSAVVALESKDQTQSFEGAAGHIDASKRAAMQPDSPYFIASVTKMVTAAAVMRLADQQRIDLEASLQRYLPDEVLKGIHNIDGVDRGADIRVYQLLNQTSGLPDFETERPPGEGSVFAKLAAGQDLAIDLQEALRITRRLKAPFAPGKPGRAHYSNLNYRLLGEIIERSCEKKLQEVFSDLIFEPLGLQQTYFYDCTAPRATMRPAQVYFRRRPAMIDRYISSNHADGGLVSTAPECLKFVRAFFEGALFDRSRLPGMMQWNPMFFPLSYGYGLMHFRLPRWFWISPLPEFIGHSGSTGSFAFFCPSKSIYLAGTLNQVSPARPCFFAISLLRALG